jgi:glycosyltransferase involved in cell wall biosynthesis
MIGFQTARALGEHVDAVVATHCFYKHAIDNGGGLGQAEPVYVDVRPWSQITHKFVTRFKLAAASATLALFPLAIAFERVVWRRFRRELSQGCFDLVHRLNPVSSALPSPLASWTSVPFVVGPVNGGLPYPTQFRQEFRQEREWLRHVRGIVNICPYVRSTYRRSAAILASCQHTIDRLPIRDKGKVFNLMEIGFDPTTFIPPPPRPHRDRLTFLFVGRLVPFKCPRVVIAAFGTSSLLRHHRLLIAGDGPDRNALEDQARSLGLQSTVEFTGMRTNAEIAELMRSADVFVFPSVRESGGMVVLEAMASGLPCVVTDYGGPANVLTNECAIKVPLGNAEELITRFRTELEKLATNKDLRNRLGKAALERAQELFTWDAKAKMIVEIYEWVLGHRHDKPDLESASSQFVQPVLANILDAHDETHHRYPSVP